MLLFFCVVATTLSSFLLFVIQPLVAKVFLPTFGGVPAVWNICLLFFQGMLVLGYLYVHLSIKFFTASKQKIFHLIILLLSVSMLPLSWQPIQLSFLSPSFSILYVLFSKLFLPIFVVCTTAPLIQLWFSHSQHLQAKDPYFLYSASNAGSMVALLGFPFLLEPLFNLPELNWFWSLLYLLFGCLLTSIALQSKTPNHKPEFIPTTISWTQRLQWLILSFAPSSLLIAVTQYITIEIAAVSLLWILPLAIYLLCFIITFARNPWITHTWMVKYQGLFLIFPLISLSKSTLTLPAWQLIGFHLVGFFALVMVCLGELVKKRPEKNHLTDFYLWLAVGGCFGGIFNSLIAPVLFNGVYEYYIAFCLCLLLRPWPSSLRWSDLRLPFCIFIVLAINYFLFNTHYSIFSTQLAYLKWVDLLIIVAIIMIILAKDQRPIKITLSIAMLFIFSQTLPGFKQDGLLWQGRNFFGVTRVYKNDHLHILMNGSTLHGMQAFSKPQQFNRLTAYYQPLESIAVLMGQTKTNLNIAIAGLGTGILSCQFRKQDSVTFYEIDPNVIKIAKNPNFFTYLNECPAHIILGDARLNLKNTPDHSFDEIIIDVFNSDAIPIHLLTREAVKMYLEKLKPNGLLLFNISNRHLNLAPVLASISQQLHWQLIWKKSSKVNSENYQLPSEWIILSNNGNITSQLIQQMGWQPVASIIKPIVWTDDFSNIVKVLK